MHAIVEWGAGARQEAKRAGLLPAKQVRRSWTHTRTACRNADQWLKHSLSENLDSLVALALIVTLLVGSLVLTGFLAVQIGQPVIPLQTLASNGWFHVQSLTCMLCASVQSLSCHDPAELSQLSGASSHTITKQHVHSHCRVHWPVLHCGTCVCS